MKRTLLALALGGLAFAAYATTPATSPGDNMKTLYSASNASQAVTQGANSDAGSTAASASVATTQAKKNVSQQHITVGIVDVQKIFSQSPEVQATKAKLHKEFLAKRAQAQTAVKSLDAMMADYKKNSEVMDAGKRSEMEKTIAAKQSSIMQMESSFQEQAQAAEKKSMDEFVGQVQKAAAVVAKRDHLSLVIPNHAVIYSADSLDITPEVVAQLKQG